MEAAMSEDDHLVDVDGSYPHHLMGGHARPPVAPRASVVQLARDARRRQDEALGLEPPAALGFVMPEWRLAGSLVVLRDEANTANPARDKSSDGTIGDARHAGGGPGTAAWTASDHNPWLTVAGKGVVRAEDLDTDGLDLPAAFERIRAAAAAGRLPQLAHGGYLILLGRITAPDFTEWRTYKGTDPHVLHGHVSVSTDPARFDDRRAWGAFGPADVVPTPSPTPAGGWTGPDLTGRGMALRGAQGNNGPRVGQLQAFLRDVFPAYAKALVADGWWGPATAGVLREFAHRSGIPEADGANVGPKIAAALFRSGFDRSAAQTRVLAHLARAAR